MRLRKIAAVALVVTGGCGPTEAEAGAMLVSAGPLLLLLGYSMQWLYRNAWHRLEVQKGLGSKVATLQKTPTAIAFVITALAYLATIPRLGLVFEEEWWTAFILGGASYLAILLLAMRLSVRRVACYSSALWPAWALTIAPAFLFAMFASNEDSADSVLMLALPGGFGFGFSGLGLLLLGELGVRFYCNRRSRDGLPRALVVGDSSDKSMP